jgi:hypothetical protein
MRPLPFCKKAIRTYRFWTTCDLESQRFVFAWSNGMARTPASAGSPQGFTGFELDLMKAVLSQLIPKLDAMQGAPLTLANTSQLPNGQGVYQLIHQGKVKYVGKTDADAGLRSRLSGHVYKFIDRTNISPIDVTYRAAQIYVMTAVDVETDLIRHYGAEWNGSSFGSNDPGRNREETDKPVDGFDVLYPIDIDKLGDYLPPGDYTVHAALMALKAKLPYCFRYETADAKPKGHSWRTRPHDDYLNRKITVPQGPCSVRAILQSVVQALPQGWQATQFPSHVILYKESRTYAHGSVV